MGKSRVRFIALVMAFLMMAVFVGCTNGTSTQKMFGMEQFKSEMKGKGYAFEIKDAQQDFLPTTRQRMLIGDKAIDIYLFSSDKEMEKEAGYIDRSGFSYQNGSQGVQADWVAPPHFYKKGTLIVQYVGEDKKIMSDLTDVFGEQFAGDTPKE